jgi:L-asparagine transporter-like permease
MGGSMEAMIGQIFKEFPFWLAIVTVVFLGILLIIWLLLPLWVLFIQWNTGKMKDEIRRLANLIEKKGWHDKKQDSSEPKS